jgi:hypothetical protein
MVGFVECAGTAKNVETEVNQNFGVENAEYLRLFIDDGSNESINASLSDITYITYNIDRNIKINSYTDIDNYEIIDSKELLIDKEGNRSYK